MQDWNLAPSRVYRSRLTSPLRGGAPFVPCAFLCSRSPSGQSIGFNFRVPACLAWRVIVSIPRSRNGLPLKASRTVRHPGSFGLKPGTLSLLNRIKVPISQLAPVVRVRVALSIGPIDSPLFGPWPGCVVYRVASVACAILKVPGLSASGLSGPAAGAVRSLLRPTPIVSHGCARLSSGCLSCIPLSFPADTSPLPSPPSPFASPWWRARNCLRCIPCPCTRTR